MAFIEEESTPLEAVEPPAPGFTHIILSYKSQKIEILCRSDDGILIGQRKGMTVVFGESPTQKSSRVFVDETTASKYLRGTIARNDMRKRRTWLERFFGSPDPVFEERDGEKLIMLPADAMDIPGAMPGFK